MRRPGSAFSTPDMEALAEERRSFKFFPKSNVEKYAKEYGWTLITKDNMEEIFLQVVDTMTMSYSCKPVFMLAFLDNIEELHIHEGRLLAKGCGTPDPFDVLQTLGIFCRGGRSTIHG